MTTINELAREHGMHPYALREFSDDLLDGVEGDDGEVPADTERAIREALGTAAKLTENDGADAE
jgi:hypothetical protein